MKNMRQKISFISCMGRGFEILKTLGDAVLRLGGNDTHLLRIVRDPLLADQIALVLMGMANIQLDADLDDGLKSMAELMASGQSSLDVNKLENLLTAMGVSVNMDQEHWLRLVLQIENPSQFVDRLDKKHQAEFLRQFDWRQDPRLFQHLYKMMPEDVQQDPVIWEKWNELGIAQGYSSEKLTAEAKMTGAKTDA